MSLLPLLCFLSAFSITLFFPKFLCGTNNTQTQEKQLLEMICYQLQLLKPENIPKPPYNLGILPIPVPSSQRTPESSQTPATSATPSTSASTPKGKTQPSKSKSTPGSHSQQPPKSDNAAPPKQTKRHLPIPPEPYPPFSTRMSAYSPTVASGVLIDTVKAGMNAQTEAGANAGPGTGGAGGTAKGKRKVVRVRQ